ncbi:hypothetical protein LCGC14_1194030 [marine sediment metagenome]|uniref:Uncharacterized protein n=1 Tax=marine sediment metagenome TaxID=412755 RepID=A0A0F9P1B0_9ZZZZ|nr:MAG: hypothetical protein Lokiarch_26000 [Candidatus Lokiarchaeum sp. GC14_75]HEC37556.1 hypothetical protein [bacterium]
MPLIKFSKEGLSLISRTWLVLEKSFKFRSNEGLFCISFTNFVSFCVAEYVWPLFNTRASLILA